MIIIQYKFEKPRKLEQSFVTQTIYNSLKQIYGLIGMAKFDYEIVSIVNDQVTIQIEEELVQEFWTALTLCSQFGNVKYKCVYQQ